MDLIINSLHNSCSTIEEFENPSFFSQKLNYSCDKIYFDL